MQLMVRIRSIVDVVWNPSPLGRSDALSRMERLSAVTHLMSSGEHLARGEALRPGGLNDWEVMADGHRSGGRRASFLDRVGRPAVTRGLHVARIAASIGLIAPTRHRGVRLASNATLATTSALLHPRHHYGTDGSDQVSFLVQSLSTVARLGERRPRIVDAALWAASLQGVLSYTASGWVKVAGRTWGTGGAITGVARTRSYGDMRTWQLIRGRPGLAKALENSVVALECVAPIIFLAGGRLTRPYAAAATGLHLGIARVMALGRFVPSFCSLHAPMIYTTQSDRRNRRHDKVAGIVMWAGLGLVAVAAGQRAVTRRTVERARGDERNVELSDGNAVAYRVIGDRASATSSEDRAPLVVFENGLLATPDHWEWIVRHLRSTADDPVPTVVTSHRSGYGPSTHLPGTMLTMSDIVDASTELIDHVAADRDVILVGHSLGGYLAMLATVRTTARVRGVVLVDSSHPDELRRSERQRLGAERLRDGFVSMTTSLNAGSGLLLGVPPWVSALPPEAQRVALAQFRDPRMWKAAIREWDATVRDFGASPGLPRLSCPALVLTAAHTRHSDPVQYELHAEMLEHASGGSHVTIEGADHDSILTNQVHAGRAANEIARFVAACVDRSAPIDSPPVRDAELELTS